MDTKDKIIKDLEEQLSTEKIVKRSEVVLNKEKTLANQEKEIAVELLSKLNDTLIKENARLRNIIQTIIKIK
tara:strand:- start:5308 stop:5523 length:216 start_codon:yes stop_codon:yes gene_type:complete